MNQLKIVLDILPKLNTSDLEDIIKRVAFLKNSKSKKYPRVEEELFYNTLISELGKKIKKKQPPFYAFQKQGNYKNFKIAFEATLDYIEIAFKNQRINRAAKQHIYLITTKIVINDFDTSPIPLSLRTLVNGFTILPSLMAREFPGYIASGLLPMILKAKYANKKPREENEDNI